MRIPGLDIVKQARVAELTKKHSNLPERYIKRCLERVQYKAPKLPNYRQITVKHINRHFDQNRPWSFEFQTKNLILNRKRPICVEPIKEWSVFRGDRVEILTGKDKGKQGIICEIIQERNWVYVEGLNMKLKYIGKTRTFPGILTSVEAPLLVTTDVSLVDPGDLRPTRISWRYTEQGERVRVSERTGKIIPIPLIESETYDYKLKEGYIENKKDTSAEETARITFVPTLATFEMSIMDELGIQEDKIPAKTYWY